MIQRIVDNDIELAIVIPAGHHSNGIEFFSNENYSQQLALMSHKEGKSIDAHIHNYETRNVHNTQEVLILRKGILRVDFYSQEKKYINSILLYEGDVILLAQGGHGFKIIEDVEMIEIKQGPYLGNNDKERFEGISDCDVKWREE